MADCAVSESETVTLKPEEIKEIPAAVKQDEVKETKEVTEGKHSEAVAKHYNELQETGLESRAQSRIFYMRNFNNWIKSMLISDTLSKLRKEDHHRKICTLDLCSGKGGDLRKWENGRISKVICADIAQTSVEQAEVRYSEQVQRNSRDRYPRELFSAEFIAADCTKVRLKEHYKDPSTEFDLVSCQFSFHYCFESYQQAETMLMNASECLKPGGYFIGTTPNSQELMRRLKDSESNSFGNEVYRVTFPESYEGTVSNGKVFGSKYDFHLEGVVDCPEFLVYFPALEKMAEVHGMKLIYKKPFADFFDEFHNEGEGKSLLGKMQALESYPTDQDSKLIGDESQYEHAKKKLEEIEKEGEGEERSRGHGQKLGTLSQSEWEAISLYLVFAFQKNEEKTDDVEESKSEISEEQPAEEVAEDHGKKRPLEREGSDGEPEEKQLKANE